MKFAVNTGSLQLALRAVAAHAGVDDELPTLQRVRFTVAPDHLAVSATNRYTVGHAVIDTNDDSDGELGHFDLTPTDVKEILVLFSKTAKELQPDDSLRFEVTDDFTTVTDVAGLFEGKALQLPRTPTDDKFPNVVALLKQNIESTGEATNRLVTSGELFGLFMKAASVYREPLVVDLSGSKGVVRITCGASFIGLLMPMSLPEETAAEVHGWHTAWLARFEDIEATS